MMVFGIDGFYFETCESVSFKDLNLTDRPNHFDFVLIVIKWKPVN